MHHRIPMPRIGMVLAVVLVTAARADPPAERSIDRLESWPVLGVTRWYGFERIPVVVGARAEAPARAPEAAVAHRESEQSARRLAGLRDRWAVLRPEAARLLGLVRPDLTDLVASCRVEDTGLSTLLRAVTGSPSDAPHLVFEFDLGTTDRPRLAHLRIHAAPSGDEPAADGKVSWRRYALRTLPLLFQRTPEGDVATRTVAGGHYFDWKPHWRGRPLPERWWLRFAALRRRDLQVLAWTARVDEPDVRAAIGALQRFRFARDHQHAAMVAVRNAQAVRPDLVPFDANVWVTCALIEPGNFDVAFVDVRYRRPPSGADEADRAPVVPVWRVSIRPRGGGLAGIRAWVDPDAGGLLCLGVVGVRPAPQRPAAR